MLFSFFFNDTATTEIYTLSLHDALPIFFSYGLRGSTGHVGFSRLNTAFSSLIMPSRDWPRGCLVGPLRSSAFRSSTAFAVDRKSTRLNSSHANISYAVFCLKKKKNTYYS